MKKLYFAIILIVMLPFLLGGCSGRSTSSNTKPRKQYVIIALPNGEIIEGEIKELQRYSEGNMKVGIGDDVYWVHSARVAIVESHPTEKGGAE